MNNDEVFRDLKSSDLQKQHDAFKEVHSFMGLLAKESVEAIAQSTNPVLVAEDVFRVVEPVRRELEKLFNSTPSQEIKTLAASLLLQMGSKIGVDHLIKAIALSDNYEFIASLSLAKMGIREAVPAILRKLESFDNAFYSKAENQPALSAFLSHLKLLGGELPSHLKQRFTGPDVHPFVSAAVLAVD